jgi:hypothetical protein
MSVIDDRMQIRAADRAQALGEIAAVLAMVDGAQREPDPWERLCLLRAFSLISAGCYNLAVLEARDASLPPTRPVEDDRLAEPVLVHCDLATLFDALQEAMGEEVRAYPHLGPVALG